MCVWDVCVPVELKVSFEFEDLLRFGEKKEGF
jgi:hypothetical protein